MDLANYRYVIFPSPVHFGTCSSQRFTIIKKVRLQLDVKVGRYVFSDNRKKQDITIILK